jgi:hypothetical protein
MTCDEADRLLKPTRAYPGARTRAAFVTLHVVPISRKAILGISLLVCSERIAENP